MGPDPTKQILATLAFGYLTFLTAFCPCERLLSCHLWQAGTAVLIGGAIVVYDNFIIP